MKKLLFTLVACIVALAANATIYVVGDGEGLGWELPGLAVQETTPGSNVYKLEIKNLTKFKFSVNNTTDWDNTGGFNDGAYTTGETTFGDAVYPDGQTLPIIKYGEDQFVPWVGDYTITIDMGNMTMTAVTTTPKPTYTIENAPKAILVGDQWNNWGVVQSNIFKVSIEGPNFVYTLDNISLETNKKFKIAQLSDDGNDLEWGRVINFGTGNTVSTYNSYIVGYYDGGDTYIGSAFTGTIKLIVPQEGSRNNALLTFINSKQIFPTNLYLMGQVNNIDWNPLEGVQLTNNGDGTYSGKGINFKSGTFVFTGALGTSGSDWSTCNNNRYGPQNGDTQATIGDNTINNFGNDVSWKSVPGCYDVTVDLNNGYFTLTPVIPETFYIHTEDAGWNSPAIPMEANGTEMAPDGQTLQYVYVSEALNWTGTKSFKLSADEAPNTFTTLPYGTKDNGEFTEATTKECAYDGGNFVYEANLEGQVFTFYFVPGGACWLNLAAPAAPTYPETIYMMGDVNGDNWAVDKGVAATGADGVYTYNVTINNSNNGNGYFSFSTKLGNASDANYDVTVNTADRYGATKQNEELQKVGVPNTVKLFTPEGEEGSNTKDTYSWEAEAGTYEMTLDLTNMTLTVDKFTPLPTETEDATWAVVYEGRSTDLTGENGQYSTTFKVTAPATFYYTKTVAGGEAVKYGPADFTQITNDQQLAQSYTIAQSDQQFVFNDIVMEQATGGVDMKFMLDASNADNITVTFEKVKEQPTPETLKVYLGVAQGAVPTEPNEDYELTLNDDGSYTYDGAELEAGDFFNLWIQNATQTMALDASQYTAYGPAADNHILTFTKDITSFPETYVANSTYAWEIGNEIEVSLNFTVTPSANSMVIVNTTEIPETPGPGPDEPTTSIGELVADDIEKVLVIGQDGVVAPYDLTLTTSVRLETEEQILYNGFQFDVTVPEEFEITAVALNDELGGTVDFGTLPQNDDVVRVVAYECDGSSLDPDVEYLVELTLKKTYSTLPQAATVENYDLELDNVVFSGRDNENYDDDILGITGATSTIKIEWSDKVVPATAITITSATLETPSWNKRGDNVDAQGNVKYVTKGQSIKVTYEITAENGETPTTQTVDWSGSNASLTVNGSAGSNFVIVNTNGMTVESGQQTVSIKAKVMNQEGTAPLEGVEASFSFDVKAILMGDANDSGYVTVADVVDIADYVLTLNTPGSTSPALVFDEPNADANNDNEITSADVTAAVELVLGGSPVPTSMRRKAPTMTSDKLVADNYTVRSLEPFAIGVNLDNSYKYTSLQALVRLPEGMELIDVTPGARLTDHKVRFNTRYDGKVIVLIYSGSNDLFAEGEGSLFNLVVKATEECGDLRLTQIKGADKNANSYNLTFAGGENLTGTTGVDGVEAAEADDARYFTVDGVEVFNPEAGQILIKVAGGKAEKVVVK